jgi:Mg-chelatase subunit ChlD
MAVQAKGSGDVPKQIMTIIQEGIDAGQPVDLVFVVDTTGSMGEHIDAVRRTMGEITDQLAEASPDWQIGITQYRDITDEPLAQTEVTLTSDRATIQGGIDGLEAAGGGDICEHVFAGLDLALEEQSWRRDSSRHLIVIGDAPAHTDYVDDPRNLENTRIKAEGLTATVHTVTVGCNRLCQALATESSPDC